MEMICFYLIIALLLVVLIVNRKTVFESFGSFVFVSAIASLTFALAFSILVPHTPTKNGGLYKWIKTEEGNTALKNETQEGLVFLQKEIKDELKRRIAESGEEKKELEKTSAQLQEKLDKMQTKMDEMEKSTLKNSELEDLTKK